MFRNKGWFGGGLWKPKNPHSLEHLKYLYHLLSKNQTVTEQNKGVLVETLRSIAEILIWGDQNDSTVFDFFLEKNMLSFFLKIMKQKCGRYVCIQLLQTLNILFENIRNETSLYYLLSNNHVNSILVHKFDFSDEEVMAYYISFLKTLSLKLNNHTIHFFYNEHTNDFPLYTEAIKFFNHSESMVRIAVRTLTLNVFKGMCFLFYVDCPVDDKAMLKFIRDRTAAPYFSNLVWFIGNHVLELDSCVTQAQHGSPRSSLSDLVAEHLDHLHYLNDILCLRIDALNAVLTDHLLHRLLLPLYVYSLVQGQHPRLPDERPHVISVVSLFLLSQVFLIISHKPLVRQLAYIIFNRNMKIFSGRGKDDSSSNKSDLGSEPEFLPPEEPLEKSLQTSGRRRASSGSECSRGQPSWLANPEEQGCRGDPQVHGDGHIEDGIPIYAVGVDLGEDGDRPPTECEVNPAYLPDGPNITDEQKVEAAQRMNHVTLEQLQQDFLLTNRPFLNSIFNALDCTEDDHTALFALCLLYAMGHNAGINQELLDSVLMPSDKSETKHWYNINLVERLIHIVRLSCKYGSKVRLATLEMAIMLLKQLVLKGTTSFLQDGHLAALEQACEESTVLLRNFYKSEEMFLDVFEDEYHEMQKKPLNVEYLMMDANLLLPPMGTPMSGIEFHKRLPCGEVERARRAIRVFFRLRELSLALRAERETHLPLTNLSSCIKVNDVLDLNNSDLIGCTVVTKDGAKIRRFMVIDVVQLVLVEPDTKRVGWGVAKFVGFLQDIEVSGDKDDSRCLHIVVHRRPAGGAYPMGGVGGPSGNGARGEPLLAARFLFDDHIRCMAAKQRLNKGRLRARQRKMHQVARLLDLQVQPPSPPRHAPRPVTTATMASSGTMHRSQSQDTGLRGRSSTGPSSLSGPHMQYRPLFTSSAKVPGFAAAHRSGHRGSSGDIEGHHRRRSGSSPVSRRSGSRSRESSPRLGQHGDFSEEIPLEDLSRRSSHSGVVSQQMTVPSPAQPQICLSVPAVSSQDAGMVLRSSVQSSPHIILPCPPFVMPCPVGDLPPRVLIDDSGTLQEPPFEVPLLLPPSNDSGLLSSTPSDTMESPAEECRKPCCVNETSFSEESSTSLATEELHSRDLRLEEGREDDGEEDDASQLKNSSDGGVRVKEMWCIHSNVLPSRGHVSASTTHFKRPVLQPRWK
ncbi:protein CLEC16A-like isoform X2 [Ornithodoros turicata]|uniref:protein CLEC16A-like isoform X2 n=1 Tax=Ornithodoros turicata TaxID=34597 RepID=UPI003139A450